jgi:hypothetical protein
MTNTLYVSILRPCSFVKVNSGTDKKVLLFQANGHIENVPSLFSVLRTSAMSTVVLHSDRAGGIYLMGDVRRFTTTGIMNPVMVQQKEMGTGPHCSDTSPHSSRHTDGNCHPEA